MNCLMGAQNYAHSTGLHEAAAELKTGKNAESVGSVLGSPGPIRTSDATVNSRLAETKEGSLSRTIVAEMPVGWFFTVRRADGAYHAAVSKKSAPNMVLEKTHMHGRPRFKSKCVPQNAACISPEAGVLARQSARTEARDISGGIMTDVRAAGWKDFRAMDGSHYLPAARAHAIV